MFDVSTISKRYFKVRLGTVELQVEPPNIKMLKKVISLSRARTVEALDDLAEAVSMILSKNSTGYVVSKDMIDELDIDQMNELLTAYFEWLTKVKNSPN